MAIPLNGRSAKPSKVKRELEIEEAARQFLLDGRTGWDVLRKYITPVIRQILSVKRWKGVQENHEDLEQECWVKFIAKLKNWQPDRGTLKNYMMRCFENTTLRYLQDNLTPVPTTQIETLEGKLQTNQILTDDNLEIKVVSRIWGDREEYIIRKVCVSVYFQTFSSNRAKIISEIRNVTQFPLSKIKFLVDYALIMVRRYILAAA